ncbi:hypothetical protein [Opitutus sp. GAS368]|jgi:hypothetical protein|uniref:hypothetical protein n=1 Tax=Opitutus sp. GAS368 TaxID=1882749 RepID=UPI00087A4682|nr:hypothetical protein [Opitutus sp. GAS368]SDS60036.1 hypothetical protein SAMN05444173_3380 [Opitutus sp. GAS368]
MPVSCDDPVLAKLAALRAELIEQAYALERQGRLDAADVAVAASARVAEVCAELTPVNSAG